MRTVFRETFRSRAISLIDLPLTKCSRRIWPIVSTINIPDRPLANAKRAAHQAKFGGSILEADPLFKRVIFAGRITVIDTVDDFFFGQVAEDRLVVITIIVAT